MSDFRVMPRIDTDNEFFWTSGRDGRLRFLACDSCSYLVHPPVPVCPRCFGRALTPKAVSGKATVHTFTVNHQPWAPGAEEPYVIAVVVPDEQDDVRLTTNIVEAPITAVSIGMAVEVVFEDHDPVFLPLFRPASDGADS